MAFTEQDFKAQIKALQIVVCQQGKEIQDLKEEVQKIKNEPRVWTDEDITINPIDTY